VVLNVKEILIVKLDISVRTKSVLKHLTHVIPTLVVLEPSVLLRASQALLASVPKAHLETPKFLAPKVNVKEMKIVAMMRLVKTIIVSTLASLEFAKRIISARLSGISLLVVENMIHQNKSQNKLSSSENLTNLEKIKLLPEVQLQVAFSSLVVGMVELQQVVLEVLAIPLQPHIVVHPVPQLSSVPIIERKDTCFHLFSNFKNSLYSKGAGHLNKKLA